MRSLDSATPIVEAINNDIRHAIDEAYLQTLADEWKYTGQNVTEWKEAYENYTREVVEQLTEKAVKRSKNPEFQETSEDIKTAWKDCASKANLILNSHYPSQPDLMPFMSVSVWKSLAKLLARVSKALLEVSLSPQYHIRIVLR